MSSLDPGLVAPLPCSVEADRADERLQPLELLEPQEHLVLQREEEREISGGTHDEEGVDRSPARCLESRKDAEVGA